jgi:hypothetical protein
MEVEIKLLAKVSNWGLINYGTIECSSKLSFSSSELPILSVR